MSAIEEVLMAATVSLRAKGDATSEATAAWIESVATWQTYIETNGSGTGAAWGDTLNRALSVASAERKAQR